MNPIRNNRGFIAKPNIKFMIKKEEISNGVKKTKFILPMVLLVSLVLAGVLRGKDTNDKISK